MFETLGDRMKNWESISQHKLLPKVPVIIRVDGKAFHTVTKDAEKPFDRQLFNAMKNTAIELCKQAQGCVLAYTQSDEISLLLLDTQSIETQPWFNYRTDKIISISAAVASVTFNALFDSRAFNVPKEDVTNYFIWRQQDATRNSIQGLGQKYFSQKELHNKNSNEIQYMLLHYHGVNWNDCPEEQKRGAIVVRQKKSWSWSSAPIFQQNRDLIEKLLNNEEC